MCFVHDAGTLPFIYGVADFTSTWPASQPAFRTVRQDPKDDGELVRKLFKQFVEEKRILQRMPKDLADLFQTAAAPVQAGDRPSSALT